MGMACLIYSEPTYVYPIYQTRYIRYPTTTVNFADCSLFFREYINYYTPTVNWATVLAPVKRFIEHPEYQDRTHELFVQADKDGNGELTWSNGEIRMFILTCLHRVDFQIRHRSPTTSITNTSRCLIQTIVVLSVNGSALLWSTRCSAAFSTVSRQHMRC